MCRVQSSQPAWLQASHPNFYFVQKNIAYYLLIKLSNLKKKKIHFSNHGLKKNCFNAKLIFLTGHSLLVGR